MFSPKNLILLLALLWPPFALQAQSCFVQEDDATGSVAFSTPQLAELEAAACSLRAVFPEEFQADFAVYDFGFYLHQESYVGGTPQVFQDKIAKIEQQTPYFLVFGRQLLRGGALGKVWVEVRLPEEGSFVCYESDYFGVLQFKLQTAVLQALELGSVAMAEEEGIEKLTTFIQDIVECCDPGLRNSCSLCSWTYDDVVDYYDYAGFTTYDCEANPSSDGLDSLCLCSYPYQINSNVHGLSNGEVQLSVSYSSFQLEDGTGVDVNTLFDFLSNLGESYSEEGQVFFAAITDQTMFCSDSGDPSLRSGGGAGADKDALEASFAACDVGIWYSLIYTDNVAKLAIKAKNIDVEGAMWLLDMLNSGGGYQEKVQFIGDVLKLKEIDPLINYSRCSELFTMISNDPNSLIYGCLAHNNGINIQEYSDLLNFDMPQESLVYLNGLGEGFANQPIENGTSALTNIDYYGVEITKLPDINNDGIEDTVEEVFNAIKHNFTALASGSSDDFNPICPLGPTTDVWWEFQPYTMGVDDVIWTSSTPVNAMFFIDAGASNLLAMPFSDPGAVITSQFTNDCCWVFSTIQTPKSGSQPLAGNRQFGLRVNENGNIEFYTRAVDRARLPLVMHAWSSQWDDCGDNDYYDIGVETWSNLQVQVRNFLIIHGAEATKNTPLYTRVNFYELRKKLRSSVPVDFVSCD